MIHIFIIKQKCEKIYERIWEMIWNIWNKVWNEIQIFICCSKTKLITSMAKWCNFLTSTLSFIFKFLHGYDEQRQRKRILHQFEWWKLWLRNEKAEFDEEPMLVLEKILNGLTTEGVWKIEFSLI